MSSMDDNEISLPKATLVKLIRECMPPDMRVASETADMLVSCCTDVAAASAVVLSVIKHASRKHHLAAACPHLAAEFVLLVSSEANTVAGKEGKKTIQPEHVLKALQDLGYPEFIEEVSQAWEAFKEEAKASSTQKAALRKTGADVAGLTEAEQIALQQQMFAAARAQSMTSAQDAAVFQATYQAQMQQHGQSGQHQAQPSITMLAPPSSATNASADVINMTDDQL